MQTNQINSSSNALKNVAHCFWNFYIFFLTLVVLLFCRYHVHLKTIAALHVINKRLIVRLKVFLIKMVQKLLHVYCLIWYSRQKLELRTEHYNTEHYRVRKVTRIVGELKTLTLTWWHDDTLTTHLGVEISFEKFLLLAQLHKFVDHVMQTRANRYKVLKFDQSSLIDHQLKDHKNCWTSQTFWKSYFTAREAKMVLFTSAERRSVNTPGLKKANCK